MHIWDKRVFNHPTADGKLWRDAVLQRTEQQLRGRVPAVAEPALLEGMGQTKQDRGLGKPGRGRDRMGQSSQQDPQPCNWDPGGLPRARPPAWTQTALSCRRHGTKQSPGISSAQTCAKRLRFRTLFSFPLQQEN